VSLAAGTRLGGYEIVAALGAGAMGVVYRAWDSASEPRASDERCARCEREARALASLNHPNIPHTYGNAGRPAPMRLPRVPRRLAWIAAGLVVAAASLGADWRVARQEPPPTLGKVAQVTAEEGTETHPSLSRDGSWLAYAASGDIFLRRVGTENPVLLTGDISLQAGEPAFSPDGRLIAFSARGDGTDARGGIWLMEATGGGKRRLSDAGFSPAWRPNGEEIAYATEMATPYDRPRPSRLSIIDVTSGRARQVGTEDGMEPAWSPSGRRLAYWALVEVSHRDIFTRPADGGAATPVTSDAFVDWGPAWSHDGRHLFFCSDRSGSPNLWRVRIDEETGRVLGEPEPVSAPAPAVMHVSLAADGSRLAYEVSDLRTNVVRIPFDPVAEVVRGDPVPITSGTRIWTDLDVSIDGRLALRSQRRQEDIYVGNPDGTNITALAPDENNDRFPRWSPDGSRIAFSSTKGGEGYEIHSIRADGSDLRRHTYYQPSAVHFPIWSPDGLRLAFTAYITAGGQTYVIDSKGAWPTGPLKPLLTPPVPLDLRYRPWSWSPDGRRIVAYSERGAGMIVYDVATGTHEEVSRVGAKPRWLSDSRRLVYTHDGALHLLDTRTKKSREISRPSAGAFVDPAVSRDDRSLYAILYRDEGSIWVATVK
jgi:Tol biopolymer transport system component